MKIWELNSDGSDAHLLTIDCPEDAGSVRWPMDSPLPFPRAKGETSEAGVARTFLS